MTLIWVFGVIAIFAPLAIRRYRSMSRERAPARPRSRPCGRSPPGHETRAVACPHRRGPPCPSSPAFRRARAPRPPRPCLCRFATVRGPGRRARKVPTKPVSLPKVLSAMTGEPSSCDSIRLSYSGMNRGGAGVSGCGSRGRRAGRRTRDRPRRGRSRSRGTEALDHFAEASQATTTCGMSETVAGPKAAR